MTLPRTCYATGEIQPQYNVTLKNLHDSCKASEYSHSGIRVGTSERLPHGLEIFEEGKDKRRRDERRAIGRNSSANSRPNGTRAMRHE